jgi:hypothetical protein
MFGVMAEFEACFVKETLTLIGLNMYVADSITQTGVGTWTTTNNNICPAVQLTLDSQLSKEYGKYDVKFCC